MTLSVEELVAEQCVPVELFLVEAEHATLPVWSETPWANRYMPRGVMATFRGVANTTAPGALEMSSVVVRDARTNEILDPEVDYSVHPTFGSICLPEGSSLPSRDVVLSCRFSHLRIDSVVSPAEGELSYVRGMNGLAAPLPGSAEAVANVYLPYFADAASAQVWPVAPAAPAPSHPVDYSRGDVRIVFIGDSVTQGAEATSEQTAYREVALRALRERFPHRFFTSVTAAVGGSNSSQWLGDDETWDWGIVEQSGASIAVIEFVNDAGLPEASWRANYDELRSRLATLGADVLLTTPPYTTPSMMGDHDLSGIDRRPYVQFLRGYALEQGVPLAEVSRGWEGLRARGIPYWTMLANGINHPDDRGHELAGTIVADMVANMLIAKEQ